MESFLTIDQLFSLVERFPIDILGEIFRPETHRTLHPRPSDFFIDLRASEIKLKSVPQVVRPKKDGYISGISLELAKALLRADMCHLARAYEVLADFGCLGTSMLRSDFLNTLSEYMSKEAARTALDLLSGKESHRHATKGKYKKDKRGFQEKFGQFVVKIVFHNKEDSIIQCTNFTTNSKVSKRGRKGEGRPCKALTYIPTEGELMQILIAIGLLSSLDDDIDWITSPLKPMTVVANQTSYKAFIMATQVFEKGRGDYARKTLARPVGIHINSVRKYAERMGITVTTNEPVLTPIRDIPRLPKNVEERDLRIKMHELPGGVHIQTPLKKKFEYTQAGAAAAIADSRDKGGSGQIFKACYVASTYDPSTSEYDKSIVERKDQKTVEYDFASQVEQTILPKKTDIVGYSKEIIPTSGYLH